MTVAMPLLTAYALARHRKRPLKRLLERRENMMAQLRKAFDDARHGKGVSKRAPKDRVDQLTGGRKPHRGFRTHSSFGKA
jgi:hypothetical protein